MDIYLFYFHKRASVYNIIYERKISRTMVKNRSRFRGDSSASYARERPRPRSPPLPPNTNTLFTRTHLYNNIFYSLSRYVRLCTQVYPSTLSVYVLRDFMKLRFCFVLTIAHRLTKQNNLWYHRGYTILTHHIRKRSLPGSFWK